MSAVEKSSIADWEWVDGDYDRFTCGHCQNSEANLIDSWGEDESLLRKYHCPACGKEFLTHEVVTQEGEEK